MYLNCITDQINLDGTLQRDAISSSVDTTPSWDIMDIMNNVKVISHFMKNMFHIFKC